MTDDQRAAADAAGADDQPAAAVMADQPTDAELAEQSTAAEMVEPEPTFSEMLADQLGGMRGLTESSVPVGVFVVVNIIWSLTPALVAAIGIALAIAVWRLVQRESVRHAVNGLFGIGIGVAIAWKTGDAKDFYLPGIVMAFVYGVVLIGSVVFRHPVIGYIWAIVSAGGKHTWRQHPRLLRAFRWVTLVWAAMFISRGLVQGALYLADAPNLLGTARLVMGAPLYLAALGITIWAVRRASGHEQLTTPA